MCRFEMEGCIQKEDENRASWKKKQRLGRKKRGVQPSRTCLVLFHQPSLWKLASSSSLFPPLSHLLSSPLRKRQSEQAREVRTEGKRERGTVNYTELSKAY